MDSRLTRKEVSYLSRSIEKSRHSSFIPGNSPSDNLALTEHCILLFVPFHIHSPTPPVASTTPGIVRQRMDETDHLDEIRFSTAVRPDEDVEMLKLYRLGFWAKRKEINGMDRSKDWLCHGGLNVLYSGFCQCKHELCWFCFFDDRERSALFVRTRERKREPYRLGQNFSPSGTGDPSVAAATSG